MKEVSDIRLKDFDNIVFFTGAGISAESGVPTYRGEGGTWSKYNWEEIACETAFRKTPEIVIEFHNQRRLGSGQSGQ